MIHTFQTLNLRKLKAQGTAQAASDYALSAGWGATGSVILGGAFFDMAAQVTVAAAGAGTAANPTVTLTYKDGTWATQPTVVVCRTDTLATAGYWVVSGGSATTCVFTFVGTPVAGETYGFNYLAMGSA